MEVQRIFFPTRGRIERRVSKRKEHGLVFVGSVYSFMWGPFAAFLVYDMQGAQA